MKQSPDIASVGSKAASLAWLAEEGFPVPDWTVLQARHLDEFLASHGLVHPAADDTVGLAAVRAALLEAPWPPELEEELARAAAPLLDRGPVAARSSGTLEDLATASFAGQYESFLGLRSLEELQRGVRDCWASLFTERVFRYCARSGRDTTELRMAVIVQLMLDASAAGVAFTVDPVTGADDEVLIEACRGLGDALVAGQVDPDRYRYGWMAGEERERTVATAGEDVLAPEQVAELAQTAAAVQARRGEPVDVEWALAEGRFWLLQSRPVTRVGHAGIVGEWTTADFKDGGVSAGVCTPFMASLYDRVFSRSLPEYLNGVGLTADGTEEQPWFRVVYGRPYWNAGLVKGRLQALPGFKERRFDEDLGIRVAYEGDGVTTGLTPRSLLRGVRVLGSLQRSFRERVRGNAKIASELSDCMAAWESTDPTALADKGFEEAFVRLLREDHVRCETAYFRTIYDNSNAQTLFQDGLARLEKGGPAKDRVDALALLSGLEDISHLRPVREEAALAAELQREPAVAQAFLEIPIEELRRCYLDGESFPGDGPVRGFLERWGWLAPRTLEIRTPRWSEEPRPVFESLRRMLVAAANGSASGPSVEEREASQRQAYEAEVARCLERLRSGWPLVGFWRRRAFLRSLQTTRALLWWREEMRMHSTRMYAIVRRWSLELGRRLVARGDFAEAEDVFFLARGQVLAMLRGELDAPSARAAIRSERLYYEGFRNFSNPDEIGERWLAPEVTAASTASDGTLRGVGGSGGTYRGVARVIGSVEEVHRLRPGDVLVTRFTDPGWTSVFAELGAVITETGGVLSHAAVIAREYGFPAVLAVPEAMTAIGDGEEILVDGIAGTVCRLGSEGSQR